MCNVDRTVNSGLTRSVARKLNLTEAGCIAHPLLPLAGPRVGLRVGSEWAVCSLFVSLADRIPAEGRGLQFAPLLIGPPTTRCESPIGWVTGRTSRQSATAVHRDISPSSATLIGQVHHASHLFVVASGADRRCATSPNVNEKHDVGGCSPVETRLGWRLWKMGTVLPRVQ